MPKPPASADAADWRLLGVEHDDPERLVGRGPELLDELAGSPTPALRWYVATRPAIVLGRGQRDEEIPNATLPVLRRHSGGGAVLMDADLLSLDVLLPAGHPALTDDVGQIFLDVGRAWAEALATLGVTGLEVHQGASTARRLGNERDRLLAGICYALPGRGEVLHAGRKLVGLSQRRRRAGALVQCGMLWSWRPAPLLAALGADPQDPEVHAAAVGLRDLLPDAPATAAVAAAVERSMIATLGRV